MIVMRVRVRIACLLCLVISWAPWWIGWQVWRTNFLRAHRWSVVWVWRTDIRSSVFRTFCRPYGRYCSLVLYKMCYTYRWQFFSYHYFCTDDVVLQNPAYLSLNANKYKCSHTLRLCTNGSSIWFVPSVLISAGWNAVIKGQPGSKHLMLRFR